jgi:ABC-type glycerol-3-phosphate transport system substrate-binding protein
LRKLLSLFAIIMAVAVILAACDSGTPADPATVVTNYLQATKEGRYSDAYKLLTADSQAQITAEEYARRVDKVRQDAKIRDMTNIKVQAANIANNQATVPYSADVTLEDGSTTTLFESLKLLRQGNNWLIIWPPPSQ